MTAAGSLNDRSPVVPSLSEDWFYEDQTPNRRLGIRVRSVLEESQTSFQRLTMFETHDVGTMMVLDGCVMVTEADDFMYHEMLVHPALMALESSGQEKLSVLVVGGGDGGTAAEAVKHEHVERIEVVDIDAEVTRASREHFPEIWRRPDGTRLDEDPRVSFHHEDGCAWAERAATRGPKYDLILVDSTDPIGPATVLFEERFYRALRGALSPRGVVVCQAGSPFAQPDVTRRCHSGLARTFGEALLYVGFVPNYPSGFWSWAAASGETAIGPRLADPARAMRLLDRMVGRHGPLRYYSIEVHEAAFALPGFVKEVLSRGG